MNKKHGQFSFSGTLSCKRLYVNGVEITGSSGSGSSGSDTLSGLTDVTLSDLSSGHILRHNGSNWVNVAEDTNLFRRKDEMIVWSDILDPPDSKEVELTEATTDLGDRCEALEFKVEAFPEIEAQLTNHEDRITTNESDIDAVEARCEDLEFKAEALPEIEAQLTNHEDRITTNESDIDAVEARCEDLEFKVGALPEIEAQLTNHEDIDAVEARCEDLEFKVEALPGIEARITETEEPPWSGKEPNLVLTAASSELIKNSVADYAGWDTRKLLEELFKEVTGKWFATVTIAFTTPAYTPTFDAEISELRVGLTNVTVTPTILTNIPTIAATNATTGQSIAWTATGAAQSGGTHQTWYQQSQSRHASAADGAPSSRTWAPVGSTPTHNSTTGVIENLEIEQVAPTSGNVLLNTYTASWSLTGTVTYTPYNSGVGQASGEIKNNYGTVTNLGTTNIGKTWTIENLLIVPYLYSWKKVGSDDWEEEGHKWNAPIQNGQYHEVTIPAGERTTTTFRIWGTWDGTDGGESRKVQVQVKVVGSWLTYSFTSSGESLPSTPPSSGVTWTNASDTDASAPAPTSGATGGATWTEFGPFTGGGSALEIRYGYGSF